MSTTAPLPSDGLYAKIRAGHARRKGHVMRGFLSTSGGLSTIVRTCCTPDFR